MKLVKSLVLGSAAAFVMTAGAQAADLPGAEPVDYVKVCDIKGSTGFFYIPGTETCLQIGGFARLETTYGEVTNDDDANKVGYRVRARVWFDARTDTEYGALRTFIRLQFQRETGAVGTAGSANPQFEGDDFFYDQAFVQFAGLTAGVTDSFWDFKPYPTFQNPFISDRTVPVLAYTAKFGDASASLSLEDKTYRYRDSTNATPNAGTEAPDIVANIRVKQGWGEAQISGVASYINPKKGYADQVGGIATGVGGDNEWGWGVQGGVKLNLPTANTSDAKGDFIWGQAGYVDGAGLSYVGLGDANVGSGRTQNITAFNPQRDYYLDGDTQKTKAFNANLGALHYWSPQWRSALQGTYVDVNYRKLNADWSAWSVAGNLIWTPVKKLDIGAELVYVNTDYSNRASFPANASRKDDDAFIGRLRVQRDF
ncbi:porin [Hansschlegelia zhihuaiae]|uniref:Porin n=1 Tax=Hansschlegelia zhihuaiae TaxID=405005 RepID=A0A4Q0MLC4_9HYPH|nr:porin [Hansschlegelia zhihuaiae]RXF73859.1 porin [Hansschlegelia zhihuaiae]